MGHQLLGALPASGTGIAARAAVAKHCSIYRFFFFAKIAFQLSL